jgi:ubiquitin-protein ligase
MTGFQIPTDIYGLNRPLSIKRIQRDLNTLTHPVEEVLIEPGMITIVKKFPYRQHHLRVHIQVGQYYPFHPPVLRTEYKYPHYKYYIHKISPLADLVPDILSYVGHEGEMPLKQFLYEDNGRNCDIVLQCNKCLSPWSPCFTLQLLSDNLAPIIQNATSPPDIIN